MSARWTCACWLASLAFVGGCADGPSTYTVHASVDDGPRTPPPTIFINGEPTDSLILDFDDDGAFDAASPHVELRYEDTVIAAVDTGPPVPAECGPDGGRMVLWKMYVDVLENGVLSYGLDSYSCELSGGGASGGGLGDGYVCEGDCDPGQQCSLRAKLVDPLYSTSQCAPIGPKTRGEACTWIPDAAGAYSDCGAGLLCAEGTCHVECPEDTTQSTCGLCIHIDGMPDEVTVCPNIGDPVPAAM